MDRCVCECNVRQTQVQVQSGKTLAASTRHSPAGLAAPGIPHTLLCPHVQVALCQVPRACPVSWGGGGPPHRANGPGFTYLQTRLPVYAPAAAKASSPPLTLGKRLHSWFRKRLQAQCEAASRPYPMALVPAQPCLELPAAWPASCLFKFLASHTYFGKIFSL